MLHDGEFSLLEQFLTNDDIVSEVMSLKPETKTWKTPAGFGSYGSSSSSSSALSSPIDSELGSTETESEDEDYIAELNRQVAHYMLQDDDDDDDDDDKQNIPTFSSENNKVCKSLGFSGSPLLTPWLPISSNHGSPKVGSPLLTPWSPLSSNHGSPKEQFSQEPSPTTSNLAQNVMFHSNSDQFFTLDELRAIKLQQQQNTKDGERRAKPKKKLKPSRGRACGGFGNGRTSQPLHSSPPMWSHMQTGSGMRALFLGGSNSRNGPCGTGVFLPRGTLNLSESRNKQGSSTVLIPERVIQALRLHFDRMGALSRSTAGDLPQQHALFSQQNRQETEKMNPS